MGKIVISTNVSLDGVVQDPDGEEGFRLGGWFAQFGGKDLEPWGKVVLRGGTAAPRPCCWVAAATSGSPSAGCPATGEWADRLNGLPKYVVSSTLEQCRAGATRRS